MTGSLAAAGNLLYRGAMKEQMKRYDKLSVHYHVSCRKIADKKVFYTDEQGIDLYIPTDAVVLCVGLIPRFEEASEFAKLMYDVRMVGDCVAPRRINEAVHEGYFAGRYI